MSTATHATSTYVRGGSWLIGETSPREIFAPEDFSDEQKLMAQTAEQFMDQEVVPRAQELEEKKIETNVELLKKMAPLGLLGIDVPEKFGGMEIDKVTGMILAEKLAHEGSFACSHGSHTGIGSWPIVFYGTEAQKRKYLPRICNGEWISSYALTEPHCGSDAMALTTRADVSPDGKTYTLNGTKMFITNAGFADLFITFAKIGGEKITCFIVEKSFPGVTTGAEEHKMGIMGSSTRTLILEEARVPAENILGEIGKGHKIAFNCLNMGRLKLGAGAVGGSKFCMAHAIRYAKERSAFGKAIAEFGLIQQKIAESCARIFAAESMTYRTAALIDAILSGVSKDSPAGAEQALKGIEEYATECSIMKVMGSEYLGYVCDEAVQIYGGYGYSKDYPVERFYRDARINRIFEGTNEINRLLIPGMLLRRAMKGDLPLISAAQKLMDEIMGFPSLEEDSTEGLGQELKFVKNAKKIALMTAGAAVQRYRDKVADQQEVMGHVSNIIMEVYACESSLLRTLKMLEAQGRDKARLHVAMTQQYISGAAARVDAEARAALATIAEGDLLRTQLAALKRFSKYLPVDTAATGRLIAQAALEANGWPLKTH
ncbi:MAG: acyl-CoA dehydrogenase family protein [Acidobacteriia bacterium]|nr:acyl-CoA dehydrogenase family protein [Terriglobia bacterium]